MEPLVRVKRVRPRLAALPAYQSPGAAGLDLAAAIEQELSLAPLERASIPTGLAFEIPERFEGQVRARSGRALNDGLTLINSPGTIDSDYRGEVCLLVVNLGRQAVVIRPGERIAQLIIAPVAHARLEEAAELGPSLRGDKGFGHTGR
ncbi:MAG: dUTP diphosphatase [Deltaproteobacteria bacterium]|nr:dUTP diphosphatase [Deltaproteobacteria bacterium]